jgi:hypothetical protein
VNAICVRNRRNQLAGFGFKGVRATFTNTGKIKVAARPVDRGALCLTNVRSFQRLERQTHRKQRFDFFIAQDQHMT